MERPMTLSLRFRSQDLLQCRFAISPLNETADGLRALSSPRAAAYNLPWQRQARQQVPGLRIEPLLAVLSVPGYQPDFLSPAPGSPFTEIDEELDRVRATAPGKVAAELAECLDAKPAGQIARRAHPELCGHPAEIRDLLAGMLARAWDALIEPWWPRLRDVLDTDITYRARRLADAGIAATLGELDPAISWHDCTIRFGMSYSREIDVSGTELVLVPSVFAWPHGGISFDPPAVIYPARGIAQLWQPEPHSGEDLARLVGRTRAALLTALAQPASTTGLAARAGIPVSSVSEHLAILRATGLVSTTRAGRFLVHQRTALGVALAGD
jgi:DNA-binding transcriptional ArsR family regulator